VDAVILSAHDLSLSVPGPLGPRSLLRMLDLQVKEAEIVAVVGPNGSGKTTLLRTLAGVRPPDGGVVRLDGIDLARMHRPTRARALAYLPQSTPLYHDLAVRELVALGRAPHHLGVSGRLRGPGPTDRDAVREALQRVGVADLGGRMVSSLSGGERQRVLLARMLATDARMLVMDEPTAALDIAHMLSLLALLRELADAGHGLVVAMHDLDLARRHADRALCLHGDGAGTHRLGPVDEVLVPEQLEPVFGVDVVEHEGGLRFRAPLSARPGRP
jgi:ABC-type cobalamin/Fe3+-siderophores transport system ATPase subunit